MFEASKKAQQLFDTIKASNIIKPVIIINGCFRKRIFIEVFCKKCGKRYNTDAEYEAVFNDKAEAIKCINDSGWLVKGKDAFCENCHQRSDLSIRGLNFPHELRQCGKKEKANKNHLLKFIKK